MTETIIRVLNSSILKVLLIERPWLQQLHLKTFQNMKNILSLINLTKRTHRHVAFELILRI
jgi:hypothetical protein